MASYTTLTNAARLIISIQLESSITFLLQCVWGIEAQNCKIFSSQGLLQGGFNTILGRHCYVRKRCRTPSKEFISPTNNTAYFQLSFLFSSTGKGTAAGLRLIHVIITVVGVGAWHAFVKIWILGKCSKWTCDFSVSEKKKSFYHSFLRYRISSAWTISEKHSYSSKFANNFFFAQSSTSSESLK